MNLSQKHNTRSSFVNDEITATKKQLVKGTVM